MFYVSVFQGNAKNIFLGNWKRLFIYLFFVKIEWDRVQIATAKIIF